MKPFKYIYQLNKPFSQSAQIISCLDSQMSWKITLVYSVSSFCYRSEKSISFIIESDSNENVTGINNDSSVKTSYCCSLYSFARNIQ